MNRTKLMVASTVISVLALFFFILKSNLFIDPLVSELLTLVETEYYLKDVTIKDKSSVSSVMASLPDRYSRLLSAEEYQFYQTLQTGEYSGFGFSYDYNAGKPIIYQVYLDSEAEEHNIEVGDYIVAVSGKEIASYSEAELEKELSSHFNQTLEIDISNDENTRSLVLYADNFKLDSVDYYLLSEDLAYLKIYTFLPDTKDQLIDVVEQIKTDQISQLVIDLRGNGGGAAESSFLLADEIIPVGDIVRRERRGEKPKIIHVSGEGSLFDVAVVVLVNRYTASEAEVLTAALKDNGRAVVVGERTFGKGLTVTHFPLSDGRAAQLATESWYRPSGENIEGVGIEPSIYANQIKDWSELNWAEVW